MSAAMKFTVSIGDIARSITIRATSECTLPVYSVTKHEGMVPSSDYFKKQVYSRDVEGYKVVSRGQFAYATIHLDEGSIGVLETANECVISPMYTVFEVDESRVHAPYLLRLLKSPWALKEYTVLGNGSVHRRRSISFEALARLEVPLPSIAEQQRVSKILDKVDNLRRKRQEAICIADEFLRAAYIDTLGDPTEKPNQWPIFELGELVESTKLGLVRSSEGFGWDLPTPYLRMDAITNDGKILYDKIQGTRATPSEVADFSLKRGDLLFNTRNSQALVGKTALWDGPEGTVFNNNIMRIRLNSLIAPEVVAMQFQLPKVKRELEWRKSGTTNVFAIYYKDLRTLPIQVPSEAMQVRFVRIAQQTRGYLAKVDAMAKEAEALSHALSHRFFGELQS
jgi:type I restriction enzyme S subunit